MSTGVAQAVPSARSSPRSWDLFLLWAATGSAGVLSLLAMLSIGLIVAPFALVLLALAVVLTVRRPGSWPTIAGLGIGLAGGIGLLGIWLGRSDPENGSCTVAPDGVQTCTANGLPWTPDQFDLAASLPWFVAAVVVLAVSIGAWLLGARLVRARSHQGLGSKSLTKHP